MTYLDNAATTFPKADTVLEAMVSTYRKIGVSPGRGSYDLAIEAEEFVQTVRRKVAAFFGGADPNRVIFTSNATDALNIAIQGIAGCGDHVVSTHLEHNSVLRPLHHLCRQGLLEYDLVPFDRNGYISPDDIAVLLRPDTRLVVVSHASNVLGTIQPIGEIGRICAQRGVPLLVDAAQSAGLVPIDMEAMQISAVAFTGHKSLHGPTGIGGLVLHPDLDIQSTRFGGTGFESQDLIHPQTFPYRLEAGTINLMGIIGLSAGLDFIAEKGIKNIHSSQEMELLKKLRDGLSLYDRVDLYCAQDLTNHIGLMTINVKGIDPQDVSAILDADFDIQVRAGLHCAPLVHKSIGTYPHGGVRFSIGFFNTRQDIDKTVEAIGRITEY